VQRVMLPLARRSNPVQRGAVPAAVKALAGPFCSRRSMRRRVRSGSATERFFPRRSRVCGASLRAKQAP